MSDILAGMAQGAQWGANFWGNILGGGGAPPRVGGSAAPAVQNNTASMQAASLGLGTSSSMQTFEMLAVVAAVGLGAYVLLTRR